MNGLDRHCRFEFALTERAEYRMSDSSRAREPDSSIIGGRGSKLRDLWRDIYGCERPANNPFFMNFRRVTPRLDVFTLGVSFRTANQRESISHSEHTWSIDARRFTRVVEQFLIGLRGLAQWKTHHRNKFLQTPYICLETTASE